MYACQFIRSMLCHCNVSCLEFCLSVISRIPLLPLDHSSVLLCFITRVILRSLEMLAAESMLLGLVITFFDATCSSRSAMTVAFARLFCNISTPIVGALLVGTFRRSISRCRHGTTAHVNRRSLLLFGRRNFTAIV